MYMRLSDMENKINKIKEAAAAESNVRKCMESSAAAFFVFFRVSLISHLVEGDEITDLWYRQWPA